MYDHVSFDVLVMYLYLNEWLHCFINFANTNFYRPVSANFSLATTAGGFGA